MKNRNEQPSAKQKATGRMTEKVENRMESCQKDRDMKNKVSNAKTGMRAENSTMKNCRTEQ